MRVTVNGVRTDTVSATIGELRRNLFPSLSRAIADGMPADDGTPLREGMRIYFWEGPDMRTAMLIRNVPDVSGMLSGACVGIAGLGGLGSNIAAMLARAGVGKLVIADFDTVELSNLNRQNYTVDDLGYTKTDATEKAIHRIAPFTEVEKHTLRLDRGNIPSVFAGCDVLCEALDGAEEKAMLVSAAMEGLPDTGIVCGSGMAGCGDADLIVTKTVLGRVVVCGDGREDANDPPSVMAPRVNVCAAKMADAAIEMIRKD